MSWFPDEVEQLEAIEELLSRHINRRQQTTP